MQQLLGKVGDPRGGEGGTRKRCSGGGGGPGGGISPLPGQLPSFQEEEVTLEEGRVRMVERQLSTSDPIPIKKVAMESSSDKISVSGSECQGKTNLSRSFEESRPRLPQSLMKSNHQKSQNRSLEMDMNIGTGAERDSPLGKGLKVVSQFLNVCHGDLAYIKCLPVLLQQI